MWVDHDLHMIDVNTLVEPLAPPRARSGEAAPPLLEREFVEGECSTLPFDPPGVPVARRRWWVADLGIDRLGHDHNPSGGHEQ